MARRALGEGACAQAGNAFYFFKKSRLATLTWSSRGARYKGLGRWL